jgi:hypothetical protein
MFFGIDTLISAGASAITMWWLCSRRSKSPKPEVKAWEPFEPGVCAGLPLHPWSMQEHDTVKDVRAFWCPKCLGNNGHNQPPYCDERGGHFHFKCKMCGYEWAMLPKIPVDWAEVKVPATKVETST